MCINLSLQLRVFLSINRGLTVRLIGERKLPILCSSTIGTQCCHERPATSFFIYHSCILVRSTVVFQYFAAICWTEELPSFLRLLSSTPTITYCFTKIRSGFNPNPRVWARSMNNYVDVGRTNTRTWYSIYCPSRHLLHVLAAQTSQKGIQSGHFSDLMFCSTTVFNGNVWMACGIELAERGICLLSSQTSGTTNVKTKYDVFLLHWTTIRR